jgi:spermidine/putrescine transport system permease protein
LAIGFPTAYFIATRPSTQKNFWLFMISLPFWSNLLVRTFAIMMFIREKGFVNYILLNLDLIDKPLQIMFTPTAVWIGLVYAYLPLMVMPLYASMEKIDFRLVEAGYDLYASRWQVLRKVIVPLVKPGIVAGSILVFIPSIGAYVTPKLLGGGKSLMIGNLISNQFGTSRDWPLGSALALFLMALVMVALIIYVKNETRNTNHG